MQQTWRFQRECGGDSPRIASVFRERAGGVGRRGGGGEVRRRVAEGERRCERRGERQERETAEGEEQVSAESCCVGAARTAAKIPERERVLSFTGNV